MRDLFCELVSIVELALRAVHLPEQGGVFLFAFLLFQHLGDLLLDRSLVLRLGLRLDEPLEVYDPARFFEEAAVILDQFLHFGWLVETQGLLPEN